MPLLLPAKKVFKSPYGIILRSMLRCTKPVLYTEIQSFLTGAHYAVAFAMLVMPLCPEYVENISSRSLKKPSDQRKLRLLSAYFSIFE